MLSAIDLFYLAAILAFTLAGGFVPLTRPEQARASAGFPKGEAFSAGVFLALALMMLLPSSLAVFQKAEVDVSYPIGSLIALVAFVILLAIEHLTDRAQAKSLPLQDDVRLPATIPLVMTATIAMPSFFLGAALALSDDTAALLIFLAVILHKGTAAFALALAMTRSTLSRVQTFVLFGCFAMSTPLGILVGGYAGEHLSGSVLLVKACILALGAGTFLYMGTLHEMKRTPLIAHCCRLSCFHVHARRAGHYRFCAVDCGRGPPVLSVLLFTRLAPTFQHDLADRAARFELGVGSAQVGGVKWVRRFRSPWF